MLIVYVNRDDWSVFADDVNSDVKYQDDCSQGDRQVAPGILGSTVVDASPLNLTLKPQPTAINFRQESATSPTNTATDGIPHPSDADGRSPPDAVRTLSYSSFARRRHDSPTRMNLSGGKVEKWERPVSEESVVSDRYSTSAMTSICPTPHKVLVTRHYGAMNNDWCPAVRELYTFSFISSDW